ncbi:hypothetical protein, partial [Salmonella enterica]|uniref:hypothetical protein n=1 Tax=Salmonella enterica TaxID=28901 RepID=UPI0039E8A05C
MDAGLAFDAGGDLVDDRGLAVACTLDAGLAAPAGFVVVAGFVAGEGVAFDPGRTVAACFGGGLGV